MRTNTLMAALLCSLTIVVLGCSTDQQLVASLTDDRIEELREEYPLSAGSPAYVQTIDVSFDQILEISDAVIIAEVLKQNENFQATLSTEPGTPEGDFAEKDKAQGMEPYKPTFVSYKVKVHRVIVGEEVNENINLFYNADFVGVEPNLKPGMKIVTSIKEGTAPEQKGSYSFTRYATYYVVDDNYVLSAFQGNTEEMRNFTKQTDGKTLINMVEHIEELWAN
ncbi:hypothetical protein [Paenibacillus sp. MER 99-2]|uniref:hypothetical protein n=1 Tax=Paenibacillus sp. MER 99-2 TaxID=2939572 RepID=UPI002041C9EA|nr:hypothetical protein [Paenibacillus sp. MER 99-2]MCM3171769.1 hypothetical protein [Paenibacillus sp. MER 99-2]